MSDAAERFAQACSHPTAKGSARALLEAIARLIPDGETATPAIAIDDLAREARQHRRTVCRWLDILKAIGVIDVLDGGRGIKARYELVGLDGTRPMATAPLPLVGETPHRARRTSDPTGPTLFDDSQRDTSVFNNVGPHVRYVCQIALRLWIAVLKVLLKSARWWPTYAKSPYVDAATCGPTLVEKNPHLDLDLLSSRSEEAVDRVRARGAPEFLDWWVATFSSPVDRLRDGPLILDLLASRTFEDLQALATLFWAIRSDGVPDSNWDWIAYSDHSLVVFHRKIKFLEEERARLTRPDDVWSAILDRLASKIVRHEFVTWFEGRTALATDQGVAIEVTAPQLHIDWIERHYRASVDAAAAEVRPGAHVTFVAIAEVDRKQA